MQHELVTLPADGAALKAGSRGCGFQLLPAMLEAGAQGYSADARPGSYPVRLRFRGSRQPTAAKELTVLGRHAHYFGEEFDGFDVLGQAGECWQVLVFDSREEGVVPGPSSRAAHRLLAATVVSTSDPAGEVGFRVRPGLRSFTVYASGTLTVTAALWVRGLDGTWRDSGDVLSFDTAAGGFPVQMREVRQPADRVWFKASGGGLSLAVDGESEVG